MAGPHWRSDEGWPYADTEDELADRASEPDWDLISLHASAPHLLDCLDPLERQVLTARFGLDDGGPRSWKQLRADTGLEHDALRATLGSGLAKLRAQLSDEA